MPRVECPNVSAETPNTRGRKPCRGREIRNEEQEAQGHLWRGAVRVPGVACSLLLRAAA